MSLKMALKSIFGNLMRSILTMLGIIIGVAAVITLVSLVQGYRTQLMGWVEKQGTNRISVNAYSWAGVDVTSDLYDYCLELGDSVLGVTPNSQSGGQLQYGAKKVDNATFYFGSDQYALCNSHTLVKGRDISYLDIKRCNKVCVMSAYTADQLFGYKNPIGETVTVSGVRVQVVGIYAQKFTGDEAMWMDNFLLLPYTTAKYMGGEVYNSEFTVKARDAKSTTEAITRIKGFLATKINDSNGYYFVNSTNAEIESGNQITAMLSLVLGGIAGIALLVGGIGIMNIMLVTVTERTREIGIRRAIGAERGAIIRQFLVEASVISAAGGVIGILVGVLLTLVLGKLIFQMVLFPSIAIGLGAVAFSVLIGVGFGLYPAIKASGLQPVEALRAE